MNGRTAGGHLGHLNGFNGPNDVTVLLTKSSPTGLANDIFVKCKLGNFSSSIFQNGESEKFEWELGFSPKFGFINPIDYSDCFVIFRHHQVMC